jgi:hypothetical protein
MPYYLFKVSSHDQLELVKNLELLDEFEAYRDARAAAKQLRRQQQDQGFSYKVMFAENRLSAEEQLLEKREQPVLMEHER